MKTCIRNVITIIIFLFAVTLLPVYVGAAKTSTNQEKQTVLKVAFPNDISCTIK